MFAQIYIDFRFIYFFQVFCKDLLFVYIITYFFKHCSQYIYKQKLSCNRLFPNEDLYLNNCVYKIVLNDLQL